MNFNPEVFCNSNTFLTTFALSILNPCSTFADTEK